jgi:uncharacterized protein (DUF58 family)
MPWFRTERPTDSRPAAAGEERLADVLADVRRIELHTDRLVTDVLAGGFRSTFRGVGLEFDSVREYVEGDDPRNVDWNVTARLGRPFVKHYVEERERTLLFVFDLSPSMALGLGAWSPRQTAARFVALLGLAAIKNHDRVGLVAGGDTVSRFVLPHAGGGHVLRVVRACVEAPSAEAGDLAVLLSRVAQRVRRRAVVFVLSDFVQPGYEQALLLCGRRHDVIAVRLLPRERVAPPPLVLRLCDPLTGERRVLDFADGRVRACWLARIARWRLQHDDAIGHAGIDGLDVEIPDQPDAAAIAAPLLSFFHRREVREVRR